MKISNIRRLSPVSQIILVIILAFSFVLLMIELLSAQGSTSLIRITTASVIFRDSQDPSISANGSVIAFESDSDFLGEAIPDNQSEIWLYDTATMTFTRVTEASDWQTRDSYDPILSADGTVVVFRSDSDFLGQGIPDDQFEIWLFDTATMTYTRVTTATDGARDCTGVKLSADGTIIAFSSDSDFLGEGIPDDQNEIWMYEIGTKTYTRVTTASFGNRDSYNPDLNADGSVVAFESDSDLLGQGLPDQNQEIWIFNTATMTFTRVTTTQDSGRDGYNPSLNADGTIVAFTHDSDFLDQGIPNDQFEVWLYDTTAMTYTRITYSSDSSRSSDHASLSADGTTLAFQSDSDFLNTSIPDNQFEIWLFDTGTMTYTRITMSIDTDRSSLRPSLSADGSALAFHSDSDFHVDGIPNNQNEIWLTWLKHTIFLPLVLK